MIIRPGVLIFALLLLASCAHHNGLSSKMPLYSINELTAKNAIIWIHSKKNLNLESALDLKIKTRVGRKSNDYNYAFSVSGLRPRKEYLLSLINKKTNQLIGEIKFKTPPHREEKSALKLIWGGDLSGQNVCRHQAEGFPIFTAMEKDKADIFVGLGDMIYADSSCMPTGYFGNLQVAGGFGPSRKISDFWDHWLYNKSARRFASMVSKTAYYPVWDDHEVINDFGPKDDLGLMKPGLKAFLDYNPMPVVFKGETKLYRKRRWGKHLEMFFLDTRQYRDINTSRDNPKKTMLNLAQRNWLFKNLKKSNATWKVIVSSVPISIPTGYGKPGNDGWASGNTKTGFESELWKIIKFLKKNKINKTIWLTTDVHFASMITYHPFKSDPNFVFYEGVSGPLNARMFPTKVMDHTFNPSRDFYHGPVNPEAVTDWQEAKRWFNYGLLEIDKKGGAKLTWKDATGKKLFQKKL